MKIIKRNGSEVAFDITKIIVAITKANEDVDEADRMTPVQIRRIAESVELQCQKMNRAATVEEIEDFIVSAVDQAGSNPCPPIVLGVGLGGTSEQVMELAKRALLRPVGQPHTDAFYADMERRLLEKIDGSAAVTEDILEPELVIRSTCRRI